MSSKLGVHSEVGQLRRAIVHRPGLELSRLTPSNAAGLLFDDILWAKKAREEHDAFVAALEAAHVVTHYFGDLLTQTLAIPDARSHILDELCTPQRVGPALVAPLRQLAEDADAEELGRYLVGGIMRTDLGPLQAASLTWSALRDDDFVLAPLPNHLFPRDNSFWVYDGVVISPMAMAARQREAVHMRAIYRYHPMFADSTFQTWLGGADTTLAPASIEGGDVHVIGNGAVLIGMGERTTPAAVEMLASSLFAQQRATRVVAIELPRSHAFMHLDTVLTMLDRDTFIAYPYLDSELRSWTLTPGDGAEGGVSIELNTDLWASIASALELDKVRVLRADEDIRAAER